MKNKEQYLDLPNDFYINKDGEMASEITLKQLNDILDYIKDLEKRIYKAVELLKEAGCYDEKEKIFCDDIWYDELPELLDILQGDE